VIKWQKLKIWCVVTIIQQIIAGLNYKVFLLKTNKKICELDEYISHGAGFLGVSGIKELPLKLDFINGRLNV
jgi:hypothetical protein